MKRKLSKAGGKALSVALAMATVVSAAPFSVAAEDNVALAQTKRREMLCVCGMMKRRPIRIRGGSSGLFRLETARLEPVCLAVFRQSEFS